MLFISRRYAKILVKYFGKHYALASVVGALVDDTHKIVFGHLFR